MRIVDTTYSWDEIKVMLENRDYNFGRHKKVAEQYKAHLIKVWSEWDSNESYCRHKIFKYPFANGLVTRATYFDANVTEELDLKHVETSQPCPGPTVVICENEFRYAFEEDISHMLVWSVNEISFEEYEDFVERTYPKDTYDVMLFENPPELKSIKKLRHAHIILRKKKEKCQ